MSESALKTRITAAARSGRARGSAGRPLPILAVAAVGLLAGCANRDSITVGAIPDDYRTNHPIVIAEKEADDRPAGRRQRPRHDRVAARHARGLPGRLRPERRSGADDLGADRFGQRYRRGGCRARFRQLAIARTAFPRSRIMITSYQAVSAEASRRRSASPTSR